MAPTSIWSAADSNELSWPGALDHFSATARETKARMGYVVFQKMLPLKSLWEKKILDQK
jgi:hypothetical protein